MFVARSAPIADTMQRLIEEQLAPVIALLRRWHIEPARDHHGSPKEEDLEVEEPQPQGFGVDCWPYGPLHLPAL